MIVYVVTAVALATTGAMIGVISLRLRGARRRAKGLFTRRPAVAPENSSSSARLTISLLPDHPGKTAGPLTSAAWLTIELLPDQPGEPRK